MDTPQPDGVAPAPVGHPPRWFWLIPLLVAALRAVPFALTRIVTPPEGRMLPAVGYNPIDWFAYAAFVRQASEGPAWLLTNPYTIAPQDGRYILPVFSLLGTWCRWSGLDPFWALELARIPLLFLFFAVLWWFLAAFLPDPRRRLAAVWLIAFAGGLDFLARMAVSYAPEAVQTLAYKALSDEQGWSTFAALYNPLWIAGLTATLLALRPLLQPGGVRSRRNQLQVGLGFLLTHFVHPYSGLVVLGVAVVVPLLRWAFGLPGPLRHDLRRGGAALLPALAAIAVVSWWQNQDPTYRATAQRVLGDNPLSIFWYPITLGGIGILALRGWRHWVIAKTPGRLEMGAWTLTVIMMHSSPVFNGHHFVFHLHLPLCIVGAGAFEELLGRARQLEGRRRAMAAVFLALLLQSALAVTWRATHQSLSYQIPEPVINAIHRLGREPAGTVYTSPHIGTLLPAYTHHRVYVGHWFLSPDYAAKQAQFNALLEGRIDPADLIRFLDRERIDFVLLPPATPPAVLASVRSWAKTAVDLGPYLLASAR